MSYVDGFVVPVPTERKEAYRKLAADVAKLFMQHGATQVVECWESDVPDGKWTDFRRAVKIEPGESVVFSWIIWPSKQVRDQGHEKAMADPMMQPGGAAMPFDGKRMIFGGFDVIFEAGK